MHRTRINPVARLVQRYRMFAAKWSLKSVTLVFAGLKGFTPVVAGGFADKRPRAAQ
jgi:hypothetical protein